MRFSANRLRYVLLAGVVLLVAVVAGFFGVARYRAGRIWQRILARNGVHMQRDTNGFTYSQSSKGRTIFTLHASRATPEGHGKYALHDAVLILYGHEPGQDDRIYGSEFQYDQNEGVARALGEVHMDLQATRPGSPAPTAPAGKPLSFAPEAEAADDPNVIHVRTSGLVYMRKLGLAATGQPTEFRFGGITCTSHGAEFDSEHSNLRLLAQVQVSGRLHEQPFLLNAEHGEFDRDTFAVHLATPILHSGDRSGHATEAVLHLHKDGSLQTAEATGAVQLASGTERISAPRASAEFGAANRPQRAIFNSGVQFAQTDAAHTAHGSAQTLELTWRPEGDLNSAIATGQARFEETASGSTGSTSRRHLAAERLEAAFTPNGVAGKQKSSMLRQAHLVGSASLGSSTVISGKPGSSSDVAGEEITATFAALAGSHKPHAQTLHAEGHARLDQVAADGTHQTSESDVLDLHFAQASIPGSSSAPGDSAAVDEVQQATQTGHVTITSTGGVTSLPGKPGEAKAAPTTAHAATAVYTGEGSLLTLRGGSGAPVRVDQPSGSLQADTVVLHQGSGDADATGAVVATLLAAGGGAATHVQAAHARLEHASGVSTFVGQPGQPAQLWQGGSQVQAGSIRLENKTQDLSASPGDAGGLVHAVFAAKPAGPGASHAAVGRPAKTTEALGRAGGGGVRAEALSEAERNTVDVTAARMDYDDAQHQATFGGGVRLSGAAGEVTGERAVAFLSAPAKGKAQATGPVLAATPDLNGSLQRMVVEGDVHLQQPGRRGTGSQLTYTAATDSYALTGTPGRLPTVTADDGSVVTGTTLLFEGKESRIVVAGARSGEHTPGSPARVHTEMNLKQR